MKFRKKPIVVEAWQLTARTYKDCLDFIGGAKSKTFVAGDWNNCTIRLATLEGLLTARETDWIVRGIKGEFYPVKDSIFKESYEAVK